MRSSSRTSKPPKWPGRVRGAARSWIPHTAVRALPRWRKPLIVRSEVNIDSTELKLRRALDPQAADTRQFQGQSPFLINLDLSYDNFATGTAAGIYYNIFGQRLAEVSLGGTPDVFEEVRGTLDCTFSQQWHEYKIKLSAKNLLDSSFERRTATKTTITSPVSTTKAVRSRFRSITIANTFTEAL